MEPICYILIYIGVAAVAYWITRGLVWLDR
jgi:hypothetical protein